LPRASLLWGPARSELLCWLWARTRVELSYFMYHFTLLAILNNCV
jgi:hypothetical protein